MLQTLEPIWKLGSGASRVVIHAELLKITTRALRNPEMGVCGRSVEAQAKRKAGLVQERLTRTASVALNHEWQTLMRKMPDFQEDPFGRGMKNPNVGGNSDLVIGELFGIVKQTDEGYDVLTHQTQPDAWLNLSVMCQQLRSKPPQQQVPTLTLCLA
jgi:hypothetical protein